MPSAGCSHNDVTKSILSHYAAPHTLLISAICRSGLCKKYYSRETFWTYLFWVIDNFVTGPATTLQDCRYWSQKRSCCHLPTIHPDPCLLQKTTCYHLLPTQLGCAKYHTEQGQTSAAGTWASSSLPSQQFWSCTRRPLIGDTSMHTMAVQMGLEQAGQEPRRWTVHMVQKAEGERRV